MLLLAFHIVAVGALIVLVGAIAYRMGLREGGRRARALLEESHEATRPAPNPSEPNPR
jgi:hypothetical protein